MAICFNALNTQKGIFLLVGTQEQAKAYHEKYQAKREPGATLDAWYMLGIGSLNKEEMARFDGIIILTG